VPAAIKGRNSPNVIVANKICKTAIEYGSKKDHRKIPAGKLRKEEMNSSNMTM
jgi:hypothetical protein